MSISPSGPVSWSSLNVALFGYASRNNQLALSSLKSKTVGVAETNVGLGAFRNQPIPLDGLLLSRKFTVSEGQLTTATAFASFFNDFAGAYGWETSFSIQNEDTYVKEWVGNIKLRSSGDYTFSLSVDDEASVEINNAIVIEKYSYGSTTNTVNLTAGVYPIRVRFHENVSEQSLTIQYTPPSQSIMSLPFSDMFYGSTPFIKMDANDLFYAQGIAVGNSIATWNNKGTDTDIANATSSGNPTLQKDAKGYMVNFVGTNSQHFNFGTLKFNRFSRPTLNTAQLGITFFVVAKFDTNSVDSERIIDFGGGVNVNNIIICKQSQNGKEWLQVQINNNGPSPIDVAVNWWLVMPEKAEFHLYTIKIVNATTPTVAFFRDGKLNTTDIHIAQTSPHTILSRIIPNCYIGRSNFETTKQLNGDIRELQIYRVALHDSVISKMNDYLLYKWGIAHEV